MSLSLHMQDRNVASFLNCCYSKPLPAMSAVLSTNWPSNTSGDLQQLLQSARQCTVHLHKPSEGQDVGPCSVTLVMQPLGPTDKLILCSNARMVEVSVKRPGDSTLSYLQTVRGQPQGSSSFQGTVDLQGAVGCTSLQLKLLSLQGDKSKCTIQQLHLQQGPDPQALLPAVASTADGRNSQQHESTAAGADADASPSADTAMPRQQALSQLDELRLLIQQLHQPGDAAPVPESLQLLHSKATEAPQPGAGTAIKNLSAHIAQGMLFQAAQQRSQSQEQQPPQQQQSCLREQSSHPGPEAVGAAQASSSSPVGSATALGSVLSVLQRLEAKVDRLADNMTAGLQHLDQRLARLEAQVHIASSSTGAQL